jgi:predicted nucleic acid-binding protein
MPAATFTALYDANVLYPAPLRDLLMRLALEDLFRARWSNQIHDEWIRNVLENRKDLKRERLERTRDLMNQHVRDCLVTEYGDLIPSLTLPDPDDRHVLAAAIKAQANVIVTFNTADFPNAALEKYGIEAQHPDDFLVYQFDLNSAAVCRAVQKQRAALKNPAVTVPELLDTLARQQLPQTVERLRPFSALL